MRPRVAVYYDARVCVFGLGCVFGVLGFFRLARVHTSAAEKVFHGCVGVLHSQK